MNESNQPGLLPSEHVHFIAIHRFLINLACIALAEILQNANSAVSSLAVRRDAIEQLDWSHIFLQCIQSIYCCRLKVVAYVAEQTLANLQHSIHNVQFEPGVRHCDAPAEDFNRERKMRNP